MKTKPISHLVAHGQHGCHRQLCCLSAFVCVKGIKLCLH